MGKQSLKVKPSSKMQVILKKDLEDENILQMEQTAIIEGYPDDIKLILWQKRGKEQLYFINFNILKNYPNVKISLKYNPRKFQRHGKVTKAISATLTSKNCNFADRSHPVHWVGKVTKLPGGKIRIEVTGILDGGHRHLVITEHLLDKLLKAQHTINVFLYMDYTDEHLRDVANGLNLSGSLKDQTIMNYNHKFDMFQSAWPALFKNGHDGIFKVMENQKGWRLDADDILVLLSSFDIHKNTLDAFACKRGDKKEKFSDHNGMYAKQFPAQNLHILGQVIDYCQLYMAEILEQHAPHRVKRANARFNRLHFIGRDIDTICKDKACFYGLTACFMRMYLTSEGSGPKMKYVWKKNFVSNIEKTIRQTIYAHAKSISKTVLKAKNFGKEAPLWNEILKTIQGSK